MVGTPKRLISVTDDEGTTSYSYDANGNRISTEYPNGVITTYEYNDDNVLISQISEDTNGTVLESFEYTIGDNGERLSVTELNRTVEYSYDELNRLVSETITVGSDVSETTYTYDSNSNRLSMTKDGVTTTYDYNSLNQVTRAGDIDYTWDNAGNLVSQSSLGVIVATYTYDCHNRMITATINTGTGTIDESYTYDYLGNRTSKTSDGITTEFTTDLSLGYSQVLKAVTGSETIYYTRGFELVSRREGTIASYYLFDGGMSVRALTDEDGVITDTLVFDSFGNEIICTGTTDNCYGFQGEEFDDTGLYYLRARYMDPSTGTFTSMDTYAGSLSDPMSLHKYLFANANPIRYCDPSGRMSIGKMVLTVAILTVLSAAESGVYYYITQRDNYSTESLEFKLGLGEAILRGALRGLLSGLLSVLLVVVAEAIGVFLVLVIILGIREAYEGWKQAETGMDQLHDDDRSNDNLGSYNIAFGFVHYLLGVVDAVGGTVDFVFDYGDGFYIYGSNNGIQIYEGVPSSEGPSSHSPVGSA